MATYTRQEFVRRVLVELGAIAADEAPSAEDAVLVGQTTDQIFEGLYEEGLIPFDMDGEIPARYFVPLVRIVAQACQLPYGMGSRTPAIENNAIVARKALWKLRQPPYVPATQATYY